MRLPIDIFLNDLIKRLKFFDYEISRQKGRPNKLTTHPEVQHHITIPNYNP